MFEDQSGKYQADLSGLLKRLWSCLVQFKQAGRNTQLPQTSIVSAIILLIKSNFCSEMQFELLRIEQPLMRLCQTDDELIAVQNLCDSAREQQSLVQDIFWLSRILHNQSANAP